MLRPLNGTDLLCCMDDTESEERVKAALARAGAHSPFLKLQLERFPEIADRIARGEIEAAVAAARAEAESDRPLAARLRRERSALAVALAIADLAGLMPLERLMVELSDLADRTLERAIAAAIEERTPGEAARGFAIIALGKHGSRELNYSSDIDPIFLFDPDRLPLKPREEAGQGALRIGNRVLELLQKRDADGYAFRVD